MWRLAGSRRLSLVRGLKTEAKTDNIFKLGSEVAGFKVVETDQVVEFDLHAYRLKHLQTGADYIHLAKNDSNNVFCIGFKTIPSDSTGVPHILEHMTLCGSQRFPCRDPFFKMLNRSTATFMNAMTGADYTFYPFSTQNRQDYYNLMSVYLDAVFRPALKESDFRQEGWRIEHENVEDKNSPLIFKGVVFNEMKGAFSENYSIFGESLVNSILPSNTYSIISGGDPLTIPSLTFEQLKAFHNKFYHPSNARFYSYGNFPLRDHLEYVDKEYLKDVTQIPPAPEIPPEKRWNEMKRKHISCRVDPMAANPEKQSWIAIANLCSEITSLEETVDMHVLSELLVRGPNSSFYKTLIEPQIGAGFNPVTGYDPHYRDTLFAVGLQGMSAKDFDKVIDIYNQTIDKVINEGFDQENIEGILHNIELSIRHQSSNFGMGVLFGINPLWNHKGDVLRSLHVSEKVNHFRQTLKSNPHHLQDCVQKYFKDNKHKLVLTMSPDPNYEFDLQKKEKEILDKKLATLTPKDRDDLFRQGILLKKEQEEKQNVDVLPTLTIADLNKDVDRANLKIVGSLIPILFCTAPTNKVSYMAVIMNSQHLSGEEKCLLPLFCSVVCRMGTTERDYKALDKLVQLKTGGVGASSHLAESLNDTSNYEEAICFSSHCLDENVDAMLDIWEEIFSKFTFRDNQRFETLVKMMASNLVNGIPGAGHNYAITASSSLLSPFGTQLEFWGGMSKVRFMKNLASGELAEARAQMSVIANKLIKKDHMRILWNSCKDEPPKKLEDMLGKLPGEFKSPKLISTGVVPTKNEMGIHHIFSLPVSFSSTTIPTVHYTHEDFPALRILARLLTSQYLLPNIREKGGAYGAGAKISTQGLFSFYSYRDPEPLKSFDIYDGALAWVEKADFGQREVDEAKLGVFQSLDAPIPPGSRGDRFFLYGVTDDEMQRHRVLIKALTKDDILRAAKAYLGSPLRTRALIGPENPDLTKRTSQNWTVERAQ